MASGDDDYHIPTVTTEELDLTKVRAVVIVPGLQVSTSIFGPAKLDKSCTANVEFQPNSLEVTAVVTKKGKKDTKYKYVVKKLPGEIDKSKCEYKYKKEQIIMMLHKAEECTWAVQLSKRGLEQSEDED